MSQAVEPKKKERLFRVRPSVVPRPNSIEITSLEDIPEFDTAEDEVRFWRNHTVSKEVLDQIPEAEVEE